MKKVVIFGGGTGLSQLLKGLKMFPLDITAVVSVCDNGKSTGQLREDFDIPAVGDISKVLVQLSDDLDVLKLLSYRFNTASSIGEHSIKNLIFAALLDEYGSLDAAVGVFNKIFNIKGNVLPLTDDSVHLCAKLENGHEIIGEEEITKSNDKIKKVFYNKSFKVNPKVFKAIERADLIIFSSGSLYTSILPNLIVSDVAKSIKDSKAKKMYVCNLVTQPGETDDFKASNHIEILNKYLGKNVIDVIIVNDKKISSTLLKKYARKEDKYPVLVDKVNLQKLGVSIISDKIYTIENNTIRHDALKTGYLIFSYLMDK